MKPVKILTEGDRKLVLSRALLLYTSDKGDVYATAHTIERSATSSEAPQLSPGVPLCRQAIAAFAAAAGTATAYAGFVPERLLYTSTAVIAWWCPPSIRPSWFRNRTQDSVQHGPVAHPGLVFVVSSSDWFVFALAGDDRPLPTTGIFHAPHLNVWEGGRICTGNVKLPKSPDSSAIDQFEDAFFRSHFTHSNHQAGVEYVGGMEKLWQDQLERPDMTAMKRALVSTKENLAETITRITKHLTNQA